MALDVGERAAVVQAVVVEDVADGGEEGDLPRKSFHAGCRHVSALGPRIGTSGRFPIGTHSWCKGGTTRRLISWRREAHFGSRWPTTCAP